MHRQASFRQRRARQHAKTTVESLVTPVPSLPIAPISQEPTIRRSVRVESEASTAPAEPSQSTTVPPGLIDSTAPMTVEALQERLQAANSEIMRLKEVIIRSTNDGVSINIPVPPINAAGLTAETYEPVKVFYSGIVLEMIKATYSELERRNRQAYGFYRIDGEKKEINITVAITGDASAPVSTDGTTGASQEPVITVADDNAVVAATTSTVE